MMAETLGAFELSSGGVCRSCGGDHLVLVAEQETCLLCARDEEDNPVSSTMPEAPDPASDVAAAG